MSYRIVKITSTFYRIYGTVRSKDLEEWTSKWALKDMFAGIPGAGAEEGWYLTQFAVETNRLLGIEISAGSIDVFECFDQLSRKLIYALAKEAGMHKKILNTYFAYIDNLDVRFQMGKTLGEKHQDQTSIPQGCPFSMNMVALLMRPWIQMMIDNNIEPRTMADDLFFFTKGSDHVESAKKGMELSLSFF